MIVLSSGDNKKSLVEEVRIMRTLDHENVLKLIGIAVQGGFHERYEILVITPVMFHGQLNRFLRSNKEEAEVRKSDDQVSHRCKWYRNAGQQYFNSLFCSSLAC